MSEEMAVSDNTTGEEAQVDSDETASSSVVDAPEAPAEVPSEPATEKSEESLSTVNETPENEDIGGKEQTEPEKPFQETSDDAPKKEIQEEKMEPKDKMDMEEPKIEIKHEAEEDAPLDENIHEHIDETKKAIKRRASEAFSDAGDDEFKGFEQGDQGAKSEDYSRVLERLEAEVLAASKDFTPVRHVMATPSAPPRASKRPRTDTDGSRPSSAMSSRSDDAATDNATTAYRPPECKLFVQVSAASSPAHRGRRATTEMSSPLLRVPLERGWKRELVYRAALDAHSRRNADIYYYTPQGKKLRSTREVGEHLSGTGLTLDNFSFFKEPLGVDDPEKEIIRDAKLIRRVESPVSSPAPPALPAPLEGKRTPKPKPPKGASPEPSTPKSPPAKIKVKSMGSRLSGSAATPAPAAHKQQKKPPQPAAPTTADNNNSAAWKKPRAPEAPAPVPPAGPATPAVAPAPLAPAPAVTPAPAHPSVPPPPLQSRPPPPQLAAPDIQGRVGGGGGGGGGTLQPCSMSCGRGAVPSLACAACLCLYHPACVGHQHPHAHPFLCKNCRKSSSPPLEPPPLIHKSGVGGAAASAAPAPVPRRVPVPAKVPRQDKRVLLRMKVAGSSGEGERVWSVAPPTASPTVPAPAAAPPAPAPTPTAPSAPPSAAMSRAWCVRASLPQSLAIINGKRFIVVPRNIVTPTPQHDDKRRTRIANGAASPPAATSPRRRGRPKVDDTDHFTAFYTRAQENNYNVVVQIFQYLGMRDLAHCARVCKLWQQLAATPALWRHVRMKNSHVSDWGGLCAALKRHGTKRLDLRKMLLPQNDTVFWEQFAQHISSVDTLERIEMCRCPASAVEAVCRGVPGLRALSALAIRDALLDPAPLGALPLLHELRLKSMAGLSLTRDLSHLAALTRLQHLSLTSIKELGWCACDVIGSLPALESLELGECTFRAEFAGALGRLARLRRLRLERGTAHCAAPALLRALAALPLLTSLELVNIDVKVGFDDALAECKNIQRLLIIPTYVSQSATTNKQVLSGVLRLKDTLTHLMWGVTIELLRVTELFIDQCEQAGEAARRDLGECIPVLKPVPGCRLPAEHRHVAGPPQVEILPLPTLQRLLSAQMPNTKLKILRIPFHATWRQTLADFQ